MGSLEAGKQAGLILLEEQWKRTLLICRPEQNGQPMP